MVAVVELGVVVLVNGMKRRSNAKSWQKEVMGHMSAKSMSKLSKAKISHGTLLPPLEQAVVLSSTAIGRQLFGGSVVKDETIKAILAILTALLRETLNSDVMELSLMQAESVALAGGVPQAEFDRVKKGIVEFWADRKSRHPLASMF